MLQSDFYSWAVANSAIKAVVSSRVYPRVLAQNATLPAIVYNQTSQQPAITMVEVGGYNEATFQMSCIAASYAAAKTLAKTLRSQLHGFQGTMGSTTVQAAFQINEDDMYDQETKDIRVDCDYRFHYVET